MAQEQLAGSKSTATGKSALPTAVGQSILSAHLQQICSQCYILFGSESQYGSNRSRDLVTVTTDGWNHTAVASMEMMRFLPSLPKSPLAPGLEGIAAPVSSVEVEAVIKHCKRGKAHDPTSSTATATEVALSN